MTPPLSLALIRQRYTPFGGAERFLDRAMGALQTGENGGPGIEVTLIARQWLGETQGLRTITCNPFYWGRVWRDRSFACCVHRTLATQPFHLVQSHERIVGCDLYRAGDGVHRIWLEQRNRTKGWTGRTLTALSPYHRYILATERKMFQSKQLRAVICNSVMVSDEIQRCFATDREKLHVIYSGVDTDLFHPSLKSRLGMQTRQSLGIPDNAYLLLFVGSGFQRKGVPILLDVMAQLPEQSWLVIVGQDSHRAAMQKKAEGLGVGARVCFVGGQKEVAPFYGAADIVVLPTLYDPFPNVALEAMASGLPLVTSFQCGARDLIEQGKNGLLGDALDHNQLLENITLLQNPQYRATMGLAARKTAEPFTLEAMSQKLLRLYEDLLQEAAGSV